MDKTEYNVIKELKDILKNENWKIVIGEKIYKQYSNTLNEVSIEYDTKTGFSENINNCITKITIVMNWRIENIEKIIVVYRERTGNRTIRFYNVKIDSKEYYSIMASIQKDIIQYKDKLDKLLDENVIPFL